MVSDRTIELLLETVRTQTASLEGLRAIIESLQRRVAELEQATSAPRKKGWLG